MFSDPARRLQEEHGSRFSYERMVRAIGDQTLGSDEIAFIAERDSFYMATVTPDGWPYIQHRGGPTGFLQAIDIRTLAFADYAGNKQYITAGNLTANDRVALFLMDYPNRTRLKLIGHARTLDRGQDPELEVRLPVEKGSLVERIIRIDVVGFDWNCDQHITPRYTREEWLAAEPAKR